MHIINHEVERVLEKEKNKKERGFMKNALKTKKGVSPQSFRINKKWVRAGKKDGGVIDTILASRGIEDTEKFLNATVEDIPSGLLFNDAKKALKLLKESIKSGTKIVIYSDYDVDGATGAAVAYLMLKELGADVDYYTNDRFTQGYGMVLSGIDEIVDKHPNVGLILTVDNGIVAHGPIEYANSKGIKVIVTDHHLEGDSLPPAEAIINPKRKDTSYPFEGICGATVVWQLLRELYKKKEAAYKYLDILAIATVGDVVPILEENRIIVKEGLKMLQDETRLSLKILKEMTKTTEISSHFTLAFIYVPIFNAVGRLDGDITKVIRLLTSEDEAECREIVEELININEERKAMTEAQVIKAEELLEEKGIRKAIVVYHESFHEGIVGLIAGRLKEKYNRPAFAFTLTEQGTLKASARSIDGFHLKENLDLCKDVLLGYGGHALAAGLGVEKENLDEFEERINELADAQLTEDHLSKRLVYVDDLDEDDLTLDLIDELDKLEPYGAGFPKPLLKLNDFNVRRCFFMGKDNNHLKLLGEKASIIGWRQAKKYELDGSPLNVTSLGYPSKNVFRNNVSIQFVIEDDNFKEA